MKNLQNTMEQQARSELVEANVERAKGTNVAARVGARLISATVAPSCLLQPETGDRVLVSRSRRGAAIIAVLERGDGEAQLSVGEGAPLRLRGSAILVEAATVGVLASDALRLASDRVTVRARGFQLVADAMTTAATAVRTVAGRIDAVADRVTEHVGHCFRRVEREHVEAGDLTQRCAGIHETAGHAVFVTGRRVTRIDGGQVQIG
jgi:hypothetical protein